MSACGSRVATMSNMKSISESMAAFYGSVGKDNKRGSNGLSSRSAFHLIPACAVADNARFSSICV